jgi:hypothetical protein
MCRIWSANKAALDDDEAAAGQSASLIQLSKKVAAIIHLEDLCSEGDSAFMMTDDKGSLILHKEIDPNSAKLAQMAQLAARDKTEVLSTTTMSTTYVIKKQLQCMTSINPICCQSWPQPQRVAT